MAGLQREAGDVVGGYRVLGRLGSGGSGSVYRVVDEGGDEAALKLVDAREDEVAAARLAREVRALQSLRHPAVPHILDAELDEDETFVVFEIVAGETLFDHVRHHGPFTGDALAAFAERTASALEAVHAAGVVHRDVTPSNVMIGPDGPVLIDFGLAHRTEDARLTREGLVSGTPGYVAPEVIDGAEPGAQADRWSWAATVAFAMTGQAPFGSGTGAISRTLETDVTLPDLPGAAVLRAALGRDVNARPGMRDVVAALSGATEVMPAIAPTAVAPVAQAWAEHDAATAPTTVLPSGEHAVDHGFHEADEDPFDGVFDDHEHVHDEHDELEEEPTPPPRRRMLLVLAAVVVVAAAPLAPFVAFLVMVGFAIIARGVQRRALAIGAAVVRRGRRRTSDTVVQTIGLPWHVLRAAVETIPAALTAAAVGVGVAVGARWLVVETDALGSSDEGRYFGTALALALGALAAIIVMAYGPFMRTTRDGAHRLAAAVSPTGGLTAAWTLVAMTATLVAGIGIYVQVDAWWWPLSGIPGG
ncbi:serine/threonine-protein kinase [Demequina mangrovi]|uniref:non-specific serine/threonine protein kinase n=1 Tax=Demequina mangrovi TaxID=1043493 RepID=A0A1H6YF16_9MICO|nr:serine/threonine-protein kinase [Demequina mangrovi]SEJ38484.1 Serine/threonine protein kinase [Demequina mangrovi]